MGTETDRSTLVNPLTLADSQSQFNLKTRQDEESDLTRDKKLLGPVISSKNVSDSGVINKLGSISTALKDQMHILNNISSQMDNSILFNED